MEKVSQCDCYRAGQDCTSKGSPSNLETVSKNRKISECKDHSNCSKESNSSSSLILPLDCHVLDLYS